MHTNKATSVNILSIPLFFLLSLITTNLLFSQETKQIEILNSDYMEYVETTDGNAIKYIGDVIFKQDEAIMHCDSAYFYPDDNYVNAYHNIHVVQGDTLHLYGDYLKYLGNQKLAQVRDDVLLIDQETTLETDNLDFNLRDNIGYYFDGGHIVNGDNNLTSRMGYYYSREKLFYFRDSVVIINPDYDILSDTLKYNTVSEVAYFLGPTEIISEENYIYCENGWYDTKLNIAQFNKNAYLDTKGQLLQGDSLYYERETGLGLAFENVELYDSARQIILKGKYAIYLENPEYALLTDSAQFMQLDSHDTLFVHADTLESSMDSTQQFKILKAYRKVKMFRTDMQAKCDSMVYLESDSVFQLFFEPVIWSGENQLTAEHMDLHLANNSMDYIDLKSTSFIISKEDSIRYNQIKGRNMKGYFRNNKLYKIDVKGNGQTLYFPKDQEDLIGINRAESTDITIYLKESKIDRIKLILAPEATLFPPEELLRDEYYMKGFVWLDEHRPKDRHDIFIWKE